MSSFIDSAGGVEIADVRTRMLQLILRVSLTLGIAVYVPSVFLGLKHGLYGVVVVDTAAVLALAALHRFDGLGFRFRAASVCLTYYALAVALLLWVGSISEIYLIAFSIVSVLLFGLRPGIAAAVLSSISLFAIGALGFASPSMAAPDRIGDVVGWSVIVANFALVDVLVTLAVGVLLETIDAARIAAVASAASLGSERNVLRTLLNTLPDVVFTKDEAGAFRICNTATLSLLGAEQEQDVAGKTVFDLFPEDLARPYHDDDIAVLAGVPVTNREERSRHPDGRPIWYLTNKVPLRDASGQVVGLLGVSRDVTDRRRLLTELQVQVERMPLAYILTDAHLRFTRWNPAAEQMFGFQEAEVVGKSAFEVMVAETPTSSVATVLERIHRGTFDVHIEAEHRTKSGGTVTCKWHNTPMFDDDGVFVGLLSLAEDVSERRRLEAQLRQSQKMDAVGQLAGGVAHDFNNLLSVVLSYSELVLEGLDASNPMREDIVGIRDAGLRAADLTRQLLLFSRQQVVQPKVLDLGALLAGIDKMLRRLVGEDVELTFVPHSAIGCVRADAGSIEQVVVNLVVNARDAMPTGGKVTVELEDVTLDDEFVQTHVGASPGPYVGLYVTDTGTGMDAPTLARIFEPFFTTKERGRGTGLGLSTVFGIVQQSGGTVWVYSERGVGTTFKVYLPRVDSEVDERDPVAARTTQRGAETILLVEDETAVRDVALRILRRHGYSVLEARNGHEALLVAEQHSGDIDLLLTDIVMPNMSGPVLASLLSPIRPSMKVLCMSGYTDDAAERHGFVEGRIAHLQKPLTVEGLTRSVRAVLDATTA